MMRLGFPELALVFVPPYLMTALVLDYGITDWRRWVIAGIVIYAVGMALLVAATEDR